MRDRFAFFFLALLALLCVSCSDTSNTGGTDGNGTGSGGDGGSEDPAFADHMKLEECFDDSPCRTARAQRIEGWDPWGLSPQCLLTALRDGSPGLYRMELDHTYSNGADIDEHVFVITPSGAIETGIVSRHFDEYYNESTDYLPTERCSPKAPAFYDGCLDAVNEWERLDGEGGPGGAWDCVFPVPLVDHVYIAPSPTVLPWFEDCVEQSPTCE